MKLKDKTLKELQTIQDEIQILIQIRLEEEKNSFLKEVKDLAKQKGLSDEEVNALFDTSKRKGSLLPKYRNPEDPTKTWSGHGRKPQWFQDQVSKGTNKDDMLI